MATPSQRSKLTKKQEQFCLAMVKPGMSQSDAYRHAFKPKKMKPKTIHEEASRVAADPKVSARIQELMTPIVSKVKMTKEEWLLGMEKQVEAVFKADTRKLYDQFGNPLDFREIGDHEEKLIEGFEFEETFTKVKKADGDTDAVPTGYVKKYKLTSRIGTGTKAAIEFGKAMDWYTEKREVELGEKTLAELVLGAMEQRA